MNVRYRLAQYVRSPDFPSACPFEKTVTGVVALHSDRIESRPWIGNCEIQAERSAVSRLCRRPSLRFHEILDGFRKAVVLVTSEIVFRTLVCHHPVEEGPAGIAAAFGDGTGIFEVTLKIIPRHSRSA